MSQAIPRISIVPTIAHQPFADRVYAAFSAAIMRHGSDLDASARNAACAVARIRLHRCLDMARRLDAAAVA